MNCPSCGALNRANAEWCTQCFADLRPPAPPVEPHPPSAPESPALSPDDPLGTAPAAAPTGTAPVAAAATAAAVATARSDGPDDATGDRFRRSGDELEWRCVVCESWNPVGPQTCAVCGAPFGKSLTRREDEVEPPKVTESTASMASALLPGLGHMLLGRTGSGVARAVTYVLWLVGGVAIVVGSRGSGQSSLPALPLIGGALVVWVGSIIDVLAAARGSTQEMLRPRVFLWLVVGVIGLLIVTVFAGILSVSRDGGVT